jgi:chaperonin cofactor prefoldin
MSEQLSEEKLGRSRESVFLEALDKGGDGYSGEVMIPACMWASAQIRTLLESMRKVDEEIERLRAGMEEMFGDGGEGTRGVLRSAAKFHAKQQALNEKILTRFQGVEEHRRQLLQELNNIKKYHDERGETPEGVEAVLKKVQWKTGDGFAAVVANSTADPMYQGKQLIQNENGSLAWVPAYNQPPMDGPAIADLPTIKVTPPKKKGRKKKT